MVPLAYFVRVFSMRNSDVPYFGMIRKLLMLRAAVHFYRSLKHTFYSDAGVCRPCYWTVSFFGSASPLSRSM